MWKEIGSQYEYQTPSASLQLEPNQGLVQVRCASSHLTLPQILGVEIISATDLGICPLFQEGERPEVVMRQDSMMVCYRPTPTRPVECHARWRVGPGPTFDLEVSALTPGKWSGLAVRTCSQLGPGSIQRRADVPLLVVHRPDGQEVSYVEMCHPHDGIGVEMDGNTLRFQLFGHDLEKGVILRGRVRGMIVPRVGDEAAARVAFQRFVEEMPHLSV